MSQFSEYYAKIHRQTQALTLQFPGGDCLVTAGSTTCEVPVPLAARILIEGTHRLATQDEADAFRATQAMNSVSTPLVSTLEAARQQFAALMAGKDQSK